MRHFERFKLSSFFAAAALAASAAPAQAKLTVLTTTTDLAALVSEVGGDGVTVESIAKGTQDPHYIETKPSFMLKASRADLVVSQGLDLEIGWLPSIVHGSRNPAIAQGTRGSLEIGSELAPLEVASGKVTRADGDVHPLGNPHFTLDPIRMGRAALLVAARLAQLDSAHAAQYESRAKALQARLETKTRDWETRIRRSGVQQVVTYHKTLTYFLERFGLKNPAILEPKPGIPPTSGHIIEVIQLIRELKVPLILVENFFDPTVTVKIRQAVPSVRSETVPVSVGGAAGIKSLDDLYENLVRVIEGR